MEGTLRILEGVLILEAVIIVLSVFVYSILLERIGFQIPWKKVMISFFAAACAVAIIITITEMIAIALLVAAIIFQLILDILGTIPLMIILVGLFGYPWNPR